MNHYLVVFARSKGEVLRHQEYRNRGDALEARFAEERNHRDDPDIEIVVLGASSWDALMRTHARYVKRLDQLGYTAQS
jgi:hypothetical protein